MTEDFAIEDRDLDPEGLLWAFHSRHPIREEMVSAGDAMRTMMRRKMRH
ncbi:MAG: hypothetical protein M0Z41_07690 [Peptococcaceae bacterium]|nr:hypothetical protein [Peptococcaceae bacterium]